MLSLVPLEKLMSCSLPEGILDNSSHTTLATATHRICGCHQGLHHDKGFVLSMNPMAIICHRVVMVAGLVNGDISIMGHKAYLPSHFGENNVNVRSNVGYKSIGDCPEYMRQNS